MYLTGPSRLAATALLLLPLALPAQLIVEDSAAFQAEAEARAAAYQAERDSLEATLTFYSDTTVVLGDGLAELAVPAGYRYISGKDAATVLVDMWGNPPANGEGSLGMLFPDKYGPAALGGYGVEISYVEDGYIEDGDAADLDYDDLLQQLQEETEEENAGREAAGYLGMHLLGWAKTPHYDAANQRLHWAKKLHFDGEDLNTLNYNILFLGRRGFLTLNVIGGMKDLDEVNTDLDDFLGSITYTEGNRYADFDAGTDDIAAYGLAALIGAKVIAKTGLFATIGIFLLKGWKLVVIAFMAMAAGLKRFVGK